MKKIIYLLVLSFTFYLGINDVSATVISDGTYKIESALAKNKVLDVQNANANNFSNVQLYDFNNGLGQKWNVKHLGNNYFLITSALNDNYSLDVASASKENGANIQLYSSNNTDAQKWLIKYAGDGYYYIVSKCSGKYVDISGANTLNGTNVQMYYGNGSNAQKFKFIEIIDAKQTIEDGTYTISSTLNNNRVLDVAGMNSNNNSNVQLYDNRQLWSQRWNIKYVGDGYYSITTFLDDNKNLDVTGAGFKNGTNVQLYQSNGNDAQKWIIKEDGNGYYNIISKIDNMYVDLTNGYSYNNTNVQIYHGNGSSAQKFKFNKVSSDKLADGIYSINSLLNENMVVSANSDIALNGANVSLKNNKALNNQKWYVKHLGKGLYTLTSALGGNKVLDVFENRKTNYTNVQIYQSNNTEAQKWFINSNLDGSYSLIAANSYLNLDVSGGKTNENTNIQIYQGNNSNAQKFKFNETTENIYQRSYEDGYYNIYSALNLNKSIDVAGARKANGTNVQLYQNNSNLAQLWYLKYIKDGLYSVSSAMNLNTVLDVQGGGTVNGTNVQLYKSNNSNSQKWYIKDLGDGYVSFISAQNGLYIDVKSASTANNTNIQMYAGNDSNAQKFKLVKNTANKVYTGMDISKYQGNINWAAISNSDIGFVIIRAGYGDDLLSQDDEQFKANVMACEKYNIPYGIYLYSYAKDAGVSSASAGSEARHVLRLLNDLKANNYNPNLGTKVFLDVEDKSVASLDKMILTNIADSFCGTIENNGYSCGVYANKTWLTDKLNSSELSKKYDIWLAEWPYNNTLTNFTLAKQTKPTYNLTNYKYWQFTSNGSINGINTRVDFDLGYNIFD